jgi:tRNA (guanine-N7-)-methyltransferase
MAFPSCRRLAKPRSMFGNSRVPESVQGDIHPHLATLLDRHAGAPFRKPYADYNRAAFAGSLERWQRTAAGSPVILDSGCGVGESSLYLARNFPDHYVIGVDQSASRLARGRRSAAQWPPNLDLVRADVVDYWRLLREAGIRLDRHYLLYPNPWPKASQVSRRWHGHPVFPSLLDLGGVLECRSNWAIYLAEFCFAVRRMTQRPAVAESYAPDAAMTPFERKYLASGHRLFRMVVDLA